MRLDVEDADGPPPPPFVRRRRRRRNALIGGAALVIAGVPLVLGVISNADRPADDPSAAPDAEPDRDGDPEDEGTRGERGDPPTDDTVTRPDLASLDGIDAVYGRLLDDIDASEVSMIDFQEELSGALASEAGDDREALAAAIRDAARTGQRGLAEVRERLAEQLEDDGADAVRTAYLRHLDSWAEYMGAVEDDPAILAVQDRARAYTLAINVTADGFARTLEDELPDDLDGEVRRFAEDILERGFRGFGESNV